MPTLREGMLGAFCLFSLCSTPGFSSEISSSFGAHQPSGYPYLRVEPSSGLTAFALSQNNSGNYSTQTVKITSIGMSSAFKDTGYYFVGNDHKAYLVNASTSGSTPEISTAWPTITTMQRGAKVSFDKASVEGANYDTYYWISTSGQLYLNWDNQIGDGSTVPPCFTSVPASTGTTVAVPGMSSVKDIQSYFADYVVGATQYHIRKVLVLKNDGTVWRCGGYVGPGFPAYSAAPQQVPGLSSVTQITEDRYHDVALKSDGTVWAWGFNQAPDIYYSVWGAKTYLLGNASTASSLNTPVQVHNLYNVKAITSQSALDSDNRIWLWGPQEDFGSMQADASPEPFILGGAAVATPLSTLNGSFVVATDQSIFLVNHGAQPALKRVYDNQGKGYFWLLNTPSNDNRANAQVLSGTSGNFSPTVAGATIEPASSSDPTEHIGSAKAHASVWFHYTVPISGQLDIDTHGSPHDTVLGLYAAGGTYPLVTNDNDGSANGNSGIYTLVTAGQSFDIQLDATVLQNAPAALHYAIVANPVADLTTSVSGPANPHQNSATAYTIAGTNSGPDGATNVSLVLSVPSSDFKEGDYPAHYCTTEGSNLVCTCNPKAQIAPGETATCQITLIPLIQGDTSMTTSYNYSSAEFTDPNSANNSQTTNVTAIEPLPTSEDDVPALSDFAAIGFSTGLIGLYARMQKRRKHKAA